MARISICNIRVRDDAAVEIIATLSRALGYPELVVGPNGLLGPNPELRDAFVKRAISEWVFAMYEGQRRVDALVRYPVDGEGA